VTDGQTDGQNYDSQDRASIAASRGKNAYGDTLNSEVVSYIGSHSHDVKVNNLSVVKQFVRPARGRRPKMS